MISKAYICLLCTLKGTSQAAERQTKARTFYHPRWLHTGSQSRATAQKKKALAWKGLTICTPFIACVTHRKENRCTLQKRWVQSWGLIVSVPEFLEESRRRRKAWRRTWNKQNLRKEISCNREVVALIPKQQLHFSSETSCSLHIGTHEGPPASSRKESDHSVWRLTQNPLLVLFTMLSTGFWQPKCWFALCQLLLTLSASFWGKYSMWQGLEG